MTYSLGRIFLLILLIICAIVYACEASARSHIPQGFEYVTPQVFHSVHHEEIPLSRLSSHLRRRRAASPDVDDAPIYINISSVQDSFHIKLLPNTRLLAPGFKIYHRHSGNGSHMTENVTEGLEDEELSSCFFQGNVTSHNDTPVAMALCRGVTGVLMFPEEDYVIEPATVQSQSGHNHRHHHRHQRHHQHHQQNHHNSAAATATQSEESHIMYRRSADRQGTASLYDAKSDFNRYAKPTTQFHRARRKRSYRSKEFIMETLVVADQAMYNSHGRENITTYVLSIFNIVSQLFKHPSLGYPINVVLVGLVFLDGREPGLYISNHADKTLNSFCQWQAGIHNGRGKIHDHAVLLTGKDICSYKNAPCDTLGFAPIEGMCSELRSCIVNEDTGLSTAFTIAHEIGHNFGMLHDGDGNKCKQSTDNIMSATLSAQSGVFRWSQCSRQYMRKFLNDEQSDCLKTHSKGRAELKFPDKQPGEIFDADTQCKWQFGSHSKQCTLPFGLNPCSKLWCYKQAGSCETKFYPAAEGTSCGNGRWCQKGKCVSYGKTGPTPINGLWTEWSGWTPCSRTCGGGVKTRTRECNNPRPQYGGKGCEGEDVMHKMCHLTECETSEKDFRQRQCEGHNRSKFRGWSYKWKLYKEQKYSDVEDQCKLYCKPDGYNFFYAMSMEVTDGTRCNDYSTDVCVRGKCLHVGCDLIVGSSAKKDRCGVCRGDNSTCKVVEDIFTGQPRKNTYFSVIHLPRGSSTVSISEVEISPSNYLVVRNKRGKYYLNGNWKLDGEGIYRVAGTKFIYRRPYNRPESLTADGPILEDLVVEVLVQGVNPGIRYSFTVPKLHNRLPEAPTPHNYTWSVILTDCSEPCAGGSQVVTAHCQRDQEGEVDPAYCGAATKPGTGTFACNAKPCTPRWETEPWSVCSKTCGGGKQKRKLYCMQKLTGKKDRKMARKYCSKKNKPSRKKECNTHECPPVWYKGPWSKCSATCNKGAKTRRVVCRSKTSTGQVVLPDTMCTRHPKPPASKGCQDKKCPDKSAQWIITAWTQCTGKCDEGVRERDIKCTRQNRAGKVLVMREKHCGHMPRRRTRLSEPCKLEPCPSQNQPQWYASPWSQCSVSCGAGNQTRLVHCINQQHKRLARDCDEKSKPEEMKPCSHKSCPVQDPRCQDHFSWCQLVPKHNICDHSFYGTKCCRSCRNR